MTRHRTLVRSATAYLWYTFVVFVIALAVAITAARLLLPEAKGYRQHVEQWASSLLGQPVQIATLDATLVGFTPTLTFKDVRLMGRHGKRAIIRFDEARVGIGLLASLRQWRLVPKDLTVVGANLGVTRYENGRIVVRGMRVASLTPGTVGQTGAGGGGPDEAAAQQLTAWLFQRDVLAIKDSEVHWRDRKRGKGTLDFSDVNIRLRNAGQRHQLDFNVTLPGRIGRSLSLAVDATGDVSDPASLQGKFYLRGEGLHLAHLGIAPSLGGIAMRHGDMNVTLWGGWRGGALHSLEGRVDAQDIALDALGRQDPLALDRLGGDFRWQRSEQGWHLALHGLQLARGESTWPRTNVSVQRTAAGSGQNAALDVKASFLRLDDLAAVLLKSHKLSAKAQQWLERLQPRGDVDGIHVHVDMAHPDALTSYRAQARFSGLGLKPHGHVPGFDNLSGGLWLNEGRGGLQIDASDVALKFPKLFRQDLDVAQLRAKLDWHHQDGAWNLSAPNIIADTGAARTHSRLLLEVPDDGRSPYIDLQSAFELDDASKVPRYLPARIMKPKTVNWLDHAFRAGRVSDGGLVFTGRLADFPYADHRGRFQVKAHVRDLTLHYHDGWPAFEHADGEATFTGRGMDIRVQSGKVFHSELKGVRARIARFKDPLLVTRGRIVGSTADAVRFLADSPIGAAAADTLKSLQVGGKSTTQLSLRIPLSDRVKAKHPLHVAGQVDLHDSSLSLLDGKLDITDVNGPLHFTDKGQSASGIKGRVLGGPAQFDIYTPNVPGNHQTLISARGHIDTNTLGKRQSDLPLLKDIRGQADWQAQLTLNHGKDQRKPPATLRVTSELVNTAINLPAPLNKPRGDRCMAVFDAKFLADHRTDLRLDLGHLASVALGLGRDKGGVHLLKAQARFAGGEASLPPDNSIRLAGSIERLSVARWRKVLAPWLGGGGDRLAQGMHLPVIFDMDRLHLLKGGGADRAKAQPDPRHFPVVRGQIRDLQYDQLKLGRLSFDTARTRDGLAMRSMRLVRPKTTISGRGRWYIRDGRQHTSVDARLKSQDFGGFVHDMGLAAVISGGTTDSKLDLTWPGSPLRFSFAHLDGKMDVSVKDGTMEDIDPGAGRIFGLLSLQALPRRLTLDFGDVFKKGFSFDSITGTFRIASGSARTNNLILKSPSARILVQGRTGLAARDYDQLVTVVPEVGNTLPVAGGLAWGAQAGAIILLFQKLFKSEIDKAAQYQYKITGSWENPLIKRLAQPKKTGGGKSAAPAGNGGGDDGAGE